MRLGELLAHDDFGLRPVTSGGEDRLVTGAHSIELPDPGRWIAPGYLVLTTGLAVRGSVERQRAFIASLAVARAAALGFGAGVNFASTPEAIVSAAEEAGLPVFEVPLATAFRDVIRFVMSANLNDDLRQFHRAIAMQDYLLGALDERQPERALVERLRELLSARAAIFSSGGRLIAAAGKRPPARLWEIACSGRELTVDEEGSTVAIPVRVQGEERYCLVVSARAERPADTLLRPLVRFAARVLQLIALAHEAMAESARAERAALLDELLARPDAAQALIDRVSASGFDLDRPLRLLVAAAGSADTLRPLDRAFEERSEPRLLASAGKQMVGLWQGDEALPLEALQGRAAIGLARPFQELSHLGRALAQARAALLLAEREAEERVVSFEEVALPELLLGSAAGAEVAAAAGILAPLGERAPELLRTLEAFFEHDLDVGATARSLRLHPNSVRYRLARIEAELGRPLRSPATIAELYLALEAGRLGDAALGQTQSREGDV